MGNLEGMETETRTIREHFSVVWNNLSVLEQLFLQHSACGLENVEVDYGWRLLLLNSENIC